MLYQQGSIRDYPENGLGAHVLGFVNAAGDGQYGVEGALEKRLKGQNGLLQAVTDVRNVPLTVGKDNIRIELRPRSHGTNAYRLPAPWRTDESCPGYRDRRPPRECQSSLRRADPATDLPLRWSRALRPHRGEIGRAHV